MLAKWLFQIVYPSHVLLEGFLCRSTKGLGGTWLACISQSNSSKGVLRLCCCHWIFVSLNWFHPKLIWQRREPLDGLKMLGGLFDKLEEVMITCLVLVICDFSLSFIVECDESREGVLLLNNENYSLQFEKPSFAYLNCHDYDKLMLHKNGTIGSLLEVI